MFLSPADLGAMFSMTPFDHFLIEIACGIVMAVSCHYSIEKQRNLPTAFNLSLAVGFGLCAFEDFAHAILAYNNPGLEQYWVPWTWAMSSFTLAIQMLLGVVYSTWFVPRRTQRVMLVVSILISCALLWPGFGANFTWVQTDGFVKRWLDAGMAIMWTGVLFAFMRNSDATDQAPRYVHLFIVVGIAKHWIMALFSTHAPTLDMPLSDPYFGLSHVLKLAEYSVWGYALYKEFSKIHTPRQAINAMKAKMDRRQKQTDQRFLALKNAAKRVHRG